MRHVKEMGKAAWYMAKSGLLYGTLLGGLLSVAFLLFAIFISVSTRGVAALIREVSEQFIVWIRVVLVGAALGGGVGVIVGAIDGPILVLLTRVHLPHNQIIGGRSFIQGVNALLTV